MVSFLSSEMMVFYYLATVSGLFELLILMVQLLVLLFQNIVMLVAMTPLMP